METQEPPRKRIRFDQTAPHPQRTGKHKNPKTVSISHELRSLIKKNTSQIGRYKSRIRLEQKMSKSKGTPYLYPMEMTIDLRRLPVGMTLDGDFIQEIVGDRIVRYRVLPGKSGPRLPREEGVSSIVVFRRLSDTKIQTDPSYSTWILPNNEDFTCIPAPRTRPKRMVLIDDHLGISYDLFEHQ